MQPLNPSAVRHYVQLALAGIAAISFLAGCSTPSTSASTSGSTLGRYNIDRSQVAVSGVSSGGAMATQLHVAYSSLFGKGVGIIAAPPYNCAQGNLVSALRRCLKATDAAKPPTEDLIADAKRWSGTLIDDTAKLASARVYVFSGTQDSRVSPATVAATAAFYRHFAGDANVRFRNDVAAEHAMVTDAYGNTCTLLAPPHINNCGVDVAGELLQWIHGPLKPRAVAIDAHLIRFDQNAFRPIANRERDGLDETGWAYVPAACKAGASCKVHVALHGCQQGQQTIGDKFYRHAGYNAWAEANAMIVLYPQAVASGKPGTPSNNPAGCWDWWGYSDDGASGGVGHAQRAGVQPTAITNMVKRLQGEL